MSKVLAAVVPGILGSSLYYQRQPEPLQLWGDNFFENYRRLCAQPRCLDWSGSPARSNLLKTIRVSSYVPLVKRSLYFRLVQHAQSLQDVSAVLECSYDWRDSVLNSRVTVCNSISKMIGKDLARPPSAEDHKLLILAHSLGGLVVKAALADGLIHPDWIKRLVFIGSPLLGSPAAFRSMYSEIDLPFFAQLATVFRSLNKHQFKTHLLRSFRTFPSLSELLPAKSIRFLCYSPVSRFNPLEETYMDASRRALATTAQDAFRKADGILEANKVPVFAIYTATSSSFQTDHEYSVSAIAQPRGYDVTGVYHQDCDGDGTVPEYSARGGNYYRQLPVVNCRHAFMCEADSVLNWITQTATETARTGRP